jgi:uncharacterized protein
MNVPTRPEIIDERPTTTTASTLSTPSWIAIALVVIGAVNWGLVGLFRFDLVAAIFGTDSLLSRIVYIVVALAGVYLLAVAATRLRQIPTTRMAT